MRYLVTGGAGFIGSHIVERLLGTGHDVRVIDNFLTGKRSNLLPFLGDIELIEGDIRSGHIVRHAVRGVEVILHQAALPSVPRSVDDPVTTNEINVMGTLNVLEAARDLGVRRVVYASSSSVYGDSPELPKREDMQPNPLSPYAVSKLAGEYYCKVFSRLYGLSTVILRYFNVFGPRQDPSSQYSAVIPKFIRQMLRGERPTIYGDGEQSRDFTYVGNVVEANLLAAEAVCESGVVINCACGERTSLNDLVHRLYELTDILMEPMYMPERRGDVKHSVADVARAVELIGFSSRIGLRDGLMGTIREWQEIIRFQMDGVEGE